MMLGIALVILHIQLTLAHKPSPCPDIFTYEPLGTKDQWYGRITVSIPRKLQELWVRVQLDQPAELFGNWFGNSTTEDRKEYVIHRRNFHLKLYDPLSIRFFVKHNATRAVPSLIGIELNGKVICPSRAHAIQAPPLYISQSMSTSGIINSTAASIFEKQNRNDSDPISGDYVLPKPTRLFEAVTAPTQPVKANEQTTGKAPWHAAIFRYISINMKYICSGSLVSKNYVITAAHCLTHSKSGLPIDPALLLIYLGKYNLLKQDNNVQISQVSNITIHPQYNVSYLQNDLAILFLESSAQVTPLVRVVSLWDNKANLCTIIGKQGTVTGWGSDQIGKLENNLIQTQVPVVATKACIQSCPDISSFFAAKKTYCAGFENGTQAYVGDSGAGMVFPNSGGGWQLRGVVSLSAVLNKSSLCGTSNYIVFTDIAKHLDWIRSIVES